MTSRTSFPTSRDPLLSQKQDTDEKSPTDPVYRLLPFPIDPLLKDLSALEASCRKVSEFVTELEQKIRAWKVPKRPREPSFFQKWLTSPPNPQEEQEKRDVARTTLLECRQKYERLTPALLQQVFGLDELLGIEKFLRLEELIQLYSQQSMPVIQEDFVPLLYDCKNIHQSAGRIERIAADLFSSLRRMHREYNAFLEEEENLLQNPPPEHVFTDCTRPQETFSSKTFPYVEQELVSLPLSETSVREPLELSISPGFKEALATRFEQVLDRVLEQQKELAKIALLSNPKKKLCEWAAMARGGGLVHGTYPRQIAHWLYPPSPYFADRLEPNT